MKKKVTTDQAKFVFRIPSKLHRKLKKLAKVNSSSMNHELVQMVEHHFEAGSSGQADRMVKIWANRL